MIREYLRVTHTTAQLDPEAITNTLGSLHKLTSNISNGPIGRLNPLRATEPVTFEFVAMSAGRDEPVEFYYGADDHLEVLEQRLRSIYPSSFDVDRVEVDLLKKLLSSGDPRRSVDDVSPYGVRWRGSVDRRKDWMTTLTGLTDILGEAQGLADEGPDSSRLPLIPVIEQLVQSPQPLAFQVVFQRESDWSRAARRRTGELLDGTDTLLQKLLGFESPGVRQMAETSGRSTYLSGRSSSNSSPGRHRLSRGGLPHRTDNVELNTRYDLIQSNAPKRTFTVNLQLLALAVGDEKPGCLEEQLNSLCLVFDLIDGEFYEIDGRRLRSQGFLPESGQRYARTALDRFIERSIAKGGKRFAITNRGETRPDLVLNSDELANFVVVPPASVIPTRVVQDKGAARIVADEHSGETPDSAEETMDSELPSHGGLADDAGEEPFPKIPETVVHRDVEINQLSNVLEPLTRGERSDAVILTGPPGSGKSCTTKFTITRFHRKHPDLDVVYLNCWEDHSRFQVLYRILNEIDSTVDIHRQSTPRDVLLDRLREYDESPCIVVLDEVDQLEDKSLLYELLKLPPFSLLLIVNQAGDLLDGLDQRLVSRLHGCERVRFDRYTDDQLVDILREHAKTKLGVGKIEETELRIIAEAANGDARVACTTLRIAARRLGGSGEDGITRNIVENALPEARQELIEQNAEELTQHHHVLLQAIEEQGQIAPRNLYEKYSNRVDDPKSGRTIRDYLSTLERSNLITAEGSTRNRVYRSLSDRQP